MPHLSSVQADFRGLQTRGVCRALGQPHRCRQGSGNRNKVPQCKLVLDLTTARGHPGSLARFDLSGGLRPGMRCRGGDMWCLPGMLQDLGTALVLSVPVSVHGDHKLWSLYPQFIGSTRRGSLNSHLKDETLRVAPPGPLEINFC